MPGKLTPTLYKRFYNIRHLWKFTGSAIVNISRIPEGTCKEVGLCKVYIGHTEMKFERIYTRQRGKIKRQYKAKGREVHKHERNIKREKSE
jgi:hypothetical protein